jgi:hypothetical protein
MKEDSYFFNSKNYKTLPHCRQFIIAYFLKLSRFYHVLTIQEYSGHNRQLSVFKQQHMNLQTEHGKGYNWHFIELKDTKHDYL